VTGFYFCDNLFIARKKSENEIEWQSWDGSKMESSHTREDFFSYLDLIKSQVFFSDPLE